MAVPEFISILRDIRNTLYPQIQSWYTQIWSLKPNVDIVATNIVNVNTVATNVANVNLVGNSIVDVNNIADTILPNIAEILQADTNAQIATSMANICTSTYDEFDDRYLGAKATAPLVDNDGNALVYGTLYFDTTQNYMKVWSNAGWINAGSSVNGTTERYTYVATEGQTTFSANYEAGYIDVFLNGSKLQNGTDFTATTATSIILTISASAGDTIDIIAYSIFELSTAPTKDVVAYTVNTIEELVTIPSIYTTAIVKDLDRGGTFIWSSTGTTNGGTVFAGANGYWTRQYSGTVNVKWFGVTGTDSAIDTVGFNNCATFAYLSNTVLDGEGIQINYAGGFSCSSATAYIRWKNTSFKLTDGVKASGAFVITASYGIEINDCKLDGNRFNVSGNNAGFFVVQNTNIATFDNIYIKNLRRYGINITPNVYSVEVSNIIAEDIGIVSVALGEAIKIEHSTNVKVYNFKCTNPSGTGGGQVAKVFHCDNVKLSNFNITDADPALVYPTISMVKNSNLTYEDITINGVSQVAFEDNANINISYKNIVTSGTRRAMITGIDGAGLGDRRPQNVIIENWIDTSTDALAFNLVGIYGLTLKNINTTQNINITRSGITSDYLSENILLEDISCANLFTLLVAGNKNLYNVKVIGLWTNTGYDVTNFINSTYGTYTNSAQSSVFLAKVKFEDYTINITGTMTASGGTLLYTAPPTITNQAFSGEILANTFFTGSPAGQWSQIKWNFYDWGTPTINKAVIMTGAVARSNIALTTAWSSRRLTFTNSETSEIGIRAKISFINNTSVI